jgi:hypothetical protein
LQVTAFAKPHDSRWRWRIVNYAGDVIEESSDTFPTITTAVASGTERLAMLNVVDRSEPARPWRRGSRVPRR